MTEVSEDDSLEMEEKEELFEKDKESESPFLEKPSTLEKRRKIRERSLDPQRIQRKYKKISDTQRTPNKRKFGPKSADELRSSKNSKETSRKTRLLGQKD